MLGGFGGVGLTGIGFFVGGFGADFDADCGGFDGEGLVIVDFF